MIRAISGVCCEESDKVAMLTMRFRRSAVAAAAAVVLAFPAGISWAARPAPEGFADLTEKLVPAVVNISTTQTLKPEKQRSIKLLIGGGLCSQQAGFITGTSVSVDGGSYLGLL